ncbi:MAG TPA: amino acid permease, partial [Aequorivita sp.]|nr:amino acid permease [Aequorivita sp.]
MRVYTGYGSNQKSERFFCCFRYYFSCFHRNDSRSWLSGELKKPSVSIPLGTTLATISGMIIYFFVVFKLAKSASVQELLEQQLIMGKIAIWGVVVVPLGLAASTISSALGSVMVAPRTLQALAMDHAFPSKKINTWLAASRKTDNEPRNASLVTVIIAFIFVALGDVNEVASIISMFFMVTYGSLCLISF